MNHISKQKHAMKKLTIDIRKQLKSQADPQRAAKQQAYMKSAMPYYGVPAPAVAAICREVFRANPMQNGSDWQAHILELWRTAKFREERYVAQNLAGVSRYRRFQTMEALPVYEEMILSGAWWDLVDGVSGRLGELMLDHRIDMTRNMNAWSQADNLWLRRSAIICQLKLKKQTNTELLFQAITHNMADKEFFIRKAIGWALRSYSVTAPDDVIRFVEKYREQLSPLSKREALKRLLKSGEVSSIP